MLKQNSFALPPSNQKSEKPSMASQETAPQCWPGGGDAEATNFASAVPEDFEFCILSSGGLVPTGDDAADMCVAGEVFSGGKLLPLRLSSATSADASALLLLRSDSLDAATTAASTSGFSSRSDSRSASSSSSSSVSRSTSLKSASSDSVGRSHSSKGASLDTSVPPRRSLTNSLFYAHPSPSPRPPRRSGGSAACTARRSTGSAPPATWGIIRLGVVGAPEVYPPREFESRKVAATARGGSRSARFEQPRTAVKEAVGVDKKLGLGLLGAGLVCTCSANAVEPVGSAEAAARRRRKKAAGEKKKAGAKSAHNTVRRSRILEWLEEFSISKAKNAV